MKYVQPIYATVEGRRHRVNDQESSTSGYPNDDSVTATLSPTVSDVNTETMASEIITQSVDYTSPTVLNDLTTTPLSTVTSEVFYKQYNFDIFILTFVSIR